MIVGVLAAAGATGAARARDVVAFSAGAAPGTIIVKTSERRLYFVIGDGIALRYPIAVGRAARQWFGRVSITGKHLQPAWSPPEDLRRKIPMSPTSSRAARRTIRWGLLRSPSRAAIPFGRGVRAAGHSSLRQSPLRQSLERFSRLFSQRSLSGEPHSGEVRG